MKAKQKYFLYTSDFMDHTDEPKEEASRET
jgi:hypothetical protein